jgi:hypothetical protein
MPGRVHAPLQSAGQQQQRHAGGAADEMRQLEQRQRHEVTQHVQSRVGGGRGAGEQQHQSAQEHARGQSLRCYRANPGAQPRRGARQAGAAQPGLARGHDDERGHERKQVIDGAVGEQRGQRFVRRHSGQKQ